MMNKIVRVWDPWVRIFHWSLVLSFTIGYLSGEEESKLHIYAGYTVLGLILFRVLWGFIGSRHARFNDFVYSPMTVIQYLKGLLAKKPTRYIGHNPAGGWMVIAMLLCLFVVSFSGLKVYAIEAGLGPLADASPAMIISPAHANDDEDHDNDDDGDEGAEEFWEEIHELSSNLMLLLIFLHVGGVVLSSRMHKENLVKAMFTGKKNVSTDT